MRPSSPGPNEAAVKSQPMMSSDRGKQAFGPFESLPPRLPNQYKALAPAPLMAQVPRLSSDVSPILTSPTRIVLLLPSSISLTERAAFTPITPPMSGFFHPGES